MQESGVRFTSSYIITLLKETMLLQPSRSTKKNVSIHLSCSVHLCALFGFEPQRACSMPVGSVGVEMPSVLTPSDPLAAVHRMLCLFINEWHMALVAIDFIKPAPTPT